MSAPSTIYSLFNATDNLDDPVPPLNHKSVAYGFVITFLVRFTNTIDCVLTSLSAVKQITEHW